MSDSIATPWTVAHQAPLCMGFSGKNECWSGFPFPSPGDFSDPGIEPTSPALAGGFFIAQPLGKPNSLRPNTKFIIPMVMSPIPRLSSFCQCIILSCTQGQKSANFFSFSLCLSHTVNNQFLLIFSLYYFLLCPSFPHSFHCYIPVKLSPPHLWMTTASTILLYCGAFFFLKHLSHYGLIS